MIHILYKRKTDIHQRHILNFMGLERVEVYKTWEKGVYNTVRKKFPWAPVRPYNKRQSDKEEDSKYKQLTLDEFIDWIPILKEKYLYRFPKVQIPRYNEYAKEIISTKEWDMHRYLLGFKGFFENIFELNDLTFFDELQARLEAEGAYFKNLSVRDVFIYNLLE